MEKVKIDTKGYLRDITYPYAHPELEKKGKYAEVLKKWEVLRKVERKAQITEPEGERQEVSLEEISSLPSTFPIPSTPQTPRLPPD